VTIDAKTVKKKLDRLRPEAPPSAQAFLEEQAGIMDRLIRQGEAVSFEAYWSLLAGAVEAFKTHSSPPIPAREGAEGLKLLPQEQKAFLFQAFHEMKNPLHVLMGYAGLVLRKSGHLLPEKQKENLEKVIRSAERLNETINRLAAYCRGEPIRSKPL